MKKVNKIKVSYLIFTIGLFSLLIVGATYAYWIVANSSDNVIETDSSSYNISMNINPLYHGFSFIPMNNEDVLKGVSRKCRDKYDRGACSAYLIKVFGYNSDLGTISGTINAKSNINGLSYAVLMPSDGVEEDLQCTDIDVGLDGQEDIKRYCLYNDYNKFVFEEDQLMIDSYKVGSFEEIEFVLVIWLENDKDRSQNEDGLGSFNANVSVSVGDRGRVQGVIGDAIEVETP